MSAIENVSNLEKLLPFNIYVYQSFFNLKMMHWSKLWKTLIEALNFIVENQNNSYTGDTNYDNQ